MEPAAAAAAAARNSKFAPIYEALADYNYRYAVTLCEKRDLAAHPLAKALKARALELSGLRDEASMLASEVVRSKPTDVDVIASLSSVLRRTGDAGLMVQLCDTAVSQKPDDKDLLRQLFYAFLHVEDYKKMQTVRKACTSHYGNNYHSAAIATVAAAAPAVSYV